jgi:hypothetical protein
MNKILLILCLLIIASCSREIPSLQMVERGANLPLVEAEEEPVDNIIFHYLSVIPFFSSHDPQILHLHRF